MHNPARVVRVLGFFPPPFFFETHIYLAQPYFGSGFGVLFAPECVGNNVACAQRTQAILPFF